MKQNFTVDLISNGGWLLNLYKCANADICIYQAVNLNGIEFYLFVCGGEAFMKIGLDWSWCIVTE